MTLPTEMELRVAKALINDVPWDDLSPAAQEAALTKARAAIRAMREPTADMLSATLNVPVLGPHATSRDYDRAHWHVMIGVASPPEEA